MLLYNTKDPDRIINLDTLSEICIEDCHGEGEWRRCTVKGHGKYNVWIAVCYGEDAEEQAREILKQIKEGYNNNSPSITITANTEIR